MTLSTVLGIIGLCIAFAMVIYLPYKGMLMPYVIIAACFVVIFTNGMPLIDTFENVIMAGVAAQAASLMAVYLFGALFGKLYIDSGATQSLTSALMNILSRRANENQKRTISIVVIIFIGALLCYVGIDTNASLVTMIGLATGLFATTGVPRKYLPACLVVSTTVGYLVPGSANMIPLMIGGMLGTSAMAGALPGFLDAALVFAAAVIYLSRRVKKSTDAGETFEYGPLSPAVEVENAPHPVVAVIPLLCVIVFYNIVKLPAWLAILLALCVAIVLFWKNMNVPAEQADKSALVGKFWGIVDSLNSGVNLAGTACVFLFTFALGLVVSEAPAFQAISNGVTSLALPPLVILAILATILIGISGGPGGLVVAAAVVTTTLVPQFGVDVSACHRIIIAATSIFDSLPCCGACVMMMAMTNIKMKEGYPPIFRTTIVYTAGGLVLVTALLMLFPGLA